MADVDERFGRYFKTILADTQELRNEAHKLRYQVYCCEMGFEDPGKFQDGLEKDDYDDRSIHYLVQHIGSGQYAATTRFILPDREGSSGSFPLETHCEIYEPYRISNADRITYAEVSRFCVSKQFKRRYGEAGTLAGISSETPKYLYSEDEHRTFPTMTVALLASLVHLSRKHNISYWFALMEPALIRYFTYLGIYFNVIGPNIEFHGTRKPCNIKVEEMLDKVKEEHIEIFNILINRGILW